MTAFGQFDQLYQLGFIVMQAFQTMAKRETIKRAVEKKTADFHRLFIDDLNMVKKQFDLLKRVLPSDPVLPRYAGQATIALVLAKRVDSTWQALQVCSELLLLSDICLLFIRTACLVFKQLLLLSNICLLFTQKACLADAKGPAMYAQQQSAVTKILPLCLCPTYQAPSFGLAKPGQACNKSINAISCHASDSK